MAIAVAKSTGDTIVRPKKDRKTPNTRFTFKYIRILLHFTIINLQKILYPFRFSHFSPIIS